jgi:hypothetical protein
MDASKFDAWTRRRFGLLVGGVASFAGLSALDTADARKKRKKKKKCKKSLQPCGGKKKCCKKLRCADTFGAQSVCCTPLQGACENESTCCAGANIICDLVNNLAGKRCCVFQDDPCNEDNDCCQGTVCFEGTCQAIPSDRALKANFGTVDPADMLARVRELPITTWNYRRDDPAVRHIGPMAQDFAAAFGVGEDERHIHPLDGQGVALAAIQGLLIEVEALRVENARLAARVASLE